MNTTNTNLQNLQNLQNNQTPQNNQNKIDVLNSVLSPEVKEFFNYINSQNNMNLKKIILFYSKFSKVCEQFINALHPNYRHVLSCICVDNPELRKRLMNSKYKLNVVPTIFMLFENGKVNVHYGNELNQLISFLNKNMESFMVFKTNGNMNQKKNETIGQLQPQTIEEVNELQTNVRQKGNVTPLIINKPVENTTKKLKESVKHLPKIKQPIPLDFNKEMDVGISSKRIVPKGRKEHQKMAMSSINIIGGSKLDTIEEDEEDDEEDDEDEEEIDLQTEDGELLEDNLEDLINDDKTIDPIVKKGGKNLKDIAANMQQDRERMDETSKPVM
jgi:hypothetical protein